MACFKCSKCGEVDNSANDNNYWHARTNRQLIEENKPIRVMYKPEHIYFETNVCCTKCCSGVRFKDDSGSIGHLEEIE